MNKLFIFASAIMTTVLPDTNATLLDHAAMFKTNEGTKGIGEFIMLAAETNEILQDLVTLECNNGTNHKSKIIPGIPEPTFRKLYGFTPPMRVQGIPISDNCGQLTGYLEVDRTEADLNGNSARFLMSQAKGITEGFNKKVANSLFYSNEVSVPESFTGLAPRFNSLSAANAENIIDASDGAAVAGNLAYTSIWMVNFEDYACHAIFPKGLQAGIKTEDKGLVTVQSIDANNPGYMEAYRTYFEWNIGLSVPDWRNVVRIANIKVSDLTKGATTGADLIDLMTQAAELIHSTSGKCVFAMSRAVRSVLRRQIANKVAQSTLTMDTVAGKRVLAFDGIPVRRCDGLLSTEDAVV